MSEIPEDLKQMYEMARDDSEPYSPSIVTGLIERIAKAESALAEMAKPLDFLLPEFLQAMNDIGRYGLEKYGEDSFQARRIKGDTSRKLKRCSSQEIADHAIEHFSMYLNHDPHDHFGTDAHQLAAVAFNAMMEFYFAGLAARAESAKEAL